MPNPYASQARASSQRAMRGRVNGRNSGGGGSAFTGSSNFKRYSPNKGEVGSYDSHEKRFAVGGVTGSKAKARGDRFAKGGRTKKWDEAIRSGYYDMDDNRPEAKAAREKFKSAMYGKIGESVKKANPQQDEEPEERANGGRAKHKGNVRIVINTGGKQPPVPPMPPMPPAGGAPPGGPPGGGPPPGGGAPPPPMGGMGGPPGINPAAAQAALGAIAGGQGPMMGAGAGAAPGMPPGMPPKPPGQPPFARGGRAKKGVDAFYPGTADKRPWDYGKKTWRGFENPHPDSEVGKAKVKRGEGVQTQLFGNPDYEPQSKRGGKVQRKADGGAVQHKAFGGPTALGQQGMGVPVGSPSWFTPAWGAGNAPGWASPGMAAPPAAAFNANPSTPAAGSGGMGFGGIFKRGGRAKRGKR